MMMKIGELQDLRGYRNMQKYERQLEEGKKNIMQKKQLMQRREEEENKKAV